MTMPQRQTRKPALFRPRRVAGIAAALMALAAQLAQAQTHAQDTCPPGAGTDPTRLSPHCIMARVETTPALPAPSEAQRAGLPGNAAGWIMASMLLLMAVGGGRLREPQSPAQEQEAA